MALRAHKEDDRKKSGLSGVEFYWQDASKKPRMEYRRWQELFQMAVMGKYDIDVNEIIREKVAEKRIISLLLVSMGQAGRKALRDKYPKSTTKSVDLKNLMKKCEETFQKKDKEMRNETTKESVMMVQNTRKETVAPFMMQEK